MQQNMQQGFIQQDMQDNQLFNNNDFMSMLQQQSNIDDNKEEKLVFAGDDVDGDTIIYFAGYKDKDKKQLTLYKMKKGKFEEKKDQFMKTYNVLSYKNSEGKTIPVMITEEHYNDVCEGSKEKCLSMMKETLFELKTSKVSSKIKAFKGITTAK